MEFTPYKITETLNYMFYQIPMELFFNTNYKDALSLEAKVLYGLWCQNRYIDTKFYELIKG